MDKGFIELITKKNEVVCFNKSHIVLFFEDKGQTTLVTVDGNMFTVSKSYPEVVQLMLEKQ